MRKQTKPILAALFAATLSLAPADAEALFPLMSKVGLTPPSGFVSKGVGFEDAERQSTIAIIDFPPEAFAEIETGMTPERLKAQQMTMVSREPFPLIGAQAFLVSATQSTPRTTLWKWILVVAYPNATALVTLQIPYNVREHYPEQTIRAAFASVTMRDTVPIEEYQQVLPFALNELSGFRFVKAIPGSAALLTEGAKDSIELNEQPLVMVTAIPGAPPPPDERASYARTAISTAPGIKDVRFVRNEPLRLSGQQGFETLAEAKDRNGVEIMVVQWLRFGSGGLLRTTGISTKETWTNFYPRFRAIRDGIDPK